MADHLTSEQLLLACDGDAGAAAESHLRTCTECRQQVEDMRGVIDDYSAYHHSAIRQSQPPPPQPWKNIGAPETPARQRWPMVLAWAAAAAAVFLAVLLTWPIGRPPAASEILTRAEAAGLPASNARRILVRSSHGTLIRPAVYIRNRAEAAHPLEVRFQQAGYSWDEPLSVRSYSSWRRRLPRMKDYVRHARDPKTSEPIYVLTTEAEANSLKVATLSLREQDLKPVSAMLRFNDDQVVEMEEAAVESPVQPDTPVTTKAPAPADSVASAADPDLQELQVRTALHRLGADLGEPIQITREEGALVLSARGIGASRREQIQRAIIDLDFVVQRFEPSKSAPTAITRRSEAVQQNQNNEVRTLAEQHLQGGMSFEQLVNDALDSSDALLSRSHALAILSNRYTASAESGLSPEARQLLDNLRLDHVRLATEQAQRLASLLANGFGIESATATAPRPNWQAEVAALLESTQAFDSALTATLTGARKPDREALRQAFGRVKTNIEALGAR